MQLLAASPRSFISVREYVFPSPEALRPRLLGSHLWKLEQGISGRHLEGRICWKVLSSSISEVHSVPTEPASKTDLQATQQVRSKEPLRGS